MGTGCKEVKDLTRDLGWDEERKALAHYLAQDVIEAIDALTPEEVVRHWRITTGLTDETVKKEIKELYDTLPRVKLKAWERVNLPKKNARKIKTQLHFIESFLERFGFDSVYVVGKHTVQSLVLPVYRISTSEIELTFSSDFHGWEMVVCTTKDLTSFKQTGSFTKMEMSFEGFPEETKTFETIFENPHHFSIKLTSDHELYTFMYNLENHLSR